MGWSSEKGRYHRGTVISRWSSSIARSVRSATSGGSITSRLSSGP